MATDESALLEEIQRLSGAINQRKTVQPPPHPATRGRGRGRIPYSPTSYRPAKASFTDYVPNQRPGATSSNVPPPKEVIIDGVAFQSNGKTLVRKSATGPSALPINPTASSMTSQASTPKPTSASVSPQVRTAGLPTTINPGGQPLIRTRNGLIAADRYKTPTVKLELNAPIKRPGSMASRARFNPGVTGYSKRANPGRNLTLNKNGLSHDPTPERTPICTRFSTTGDCYKGSDCLYPHFHVGPKKGICRDFAVLGYCIKGAMCDAAHLRECPDFAETGICKKMGLKGAAGCKLPHVIRANNQQRIGIAKAPKADLAQQRRSAAVATATPATASPTLSTNIEPLKRKIDNVGGDIVLDQKKRRVSSAITGSIERVLVDAGAGGAEDNNDFISLTFMESDDEGEDDEDEDEEADDDDDDDDDEDDDDGSENADAEEPPDDRLPISKLSDDGDDEAEEQEVIGGLVAGDDLEMDGALSGW
ncbi:hypothetical protein FRB97_006664 [Tulasnella sp. 331]|nr:hypothetical protein FRB97_006664 [Tulasnella sp. 331]